MATTAQPMTAEALLALPERGDVRHELVRGELRMMSPAGGRHGGIGARLVAFLLPFAATRQLGDVFSDDTGFVLTRDPDTVRVPDASFVAAGRLPAGDLPDGYLELAPDLAVEVIAPHDRAYEIGEKVAEYLSAGTTIVWVVQPVERTVTVHERAGARRLLGEGDALDGGEVLPGLEIPVAAIFARGWG